MKLSGLASLVLVSAVILASLRSPSRDWSFAISVATLSVLLSAVVATLLAPDGGRRRAFWIGFAVVGWGYYAAAHGLWLQDEFGAPLRRTLEVVAALVYPDEPTYEEFEPFGPKTTNTVRVLRDLWILAAATLGGAIAYAFQGRAEATRDDG